MPKDNERRVDLKPRSEGQAELIEAFHHNDIIFALGPAGTGKTFLAATKAVQMYQEEEITKLILTRPAVTAEENLGYLPGDLKEKLNPYLFPLLDAFSHYWQPGILDLMEDKGEAETASVGHMRGRSFYDSIILIDEAQNLTYSQLKMVLTRFGKGCKMIITGDPDQVDLELPQESGLEKWASILEGTKGIGIVRLTNSDIQRHPVVARILRSEEKSKWHPPSPEKSC